MEVWLIVNGNYPRFSIFFLWLQSAQIFPQIYQGTKQQKKKRIKKFTGENIDFGTFIFVLPL
jgi:hypothetical protein